MNENKEKDQLLKFYYKKEKNATQAAKKIGDVYGYNRQYQYVWHKAGSNVFNLKILMSKMHLALVPNHWKSRWNYGKNWARLAH